MAEAQPVAGGDDAPDTATPHKRIRKNPAARRAEIIGAARAVFARTGYENTGLAEISEAAHVSKALLYHYFPEGRPAIFAAVIEEILGELRDRLALAAKLPFSPKRRMEHLLATLFGFFDERPDAYRQLFTEGGASQNERINASAVAARVEVTAEVAAILATTHGPPDEVLAASNGILGFALANLDLCLSGQVDAETAWRVTCEYATTRLER
jgi:AcrR family transcriptional regulator